MILLGIIGEYVGRIYISLNAAPQFVVKETINLKSGKKFFFEIGPLINL